MKEKKEKLEQLGKDRCRISSHCAGDENQIQRGQQTLFVNAAIMAAGDIVQRPWLIDIDLLKHIGKEGLENHTLTQNIPELGKKRTSDEMSQDHGIEVEIHDKKRRKGG